MRSGAWGAPGEGVPRPAPHPRGHDRILERAQAGLVRGERVVGPHGPRGRRRHAQSAMGCSELRARYYVHC